MTIRKLAAEKGIPCVLFGCNEDVVLEAIYDAKRLLKLKAKHQAMMYAGVDSTVMICGDSGTGKELFAQSIHNASSRRNQPFVAVNCAAFPESLLESELFGYEKGAFTGASPNGKAGIFEMAHKGTIFLDEIGEMAVSLQSRLLRVIQEREIVRLGGSSVIPVDVRIITATNRNLLEEMLKWPCLATHFPRRYAWKPRMHRSRLRAAP